MSTPAAAATHPAAWCSHHPKAKLLPSTHRVAWYRAKRAWLIEQLGGKCVECGTTEELEFDHLKPRNWQPNRTSRWQRLRNYIKDWERGEIALRCRSCNARKGYPAGQIELLLAAVQRRAGEPF